MSFLFFFLKAHNANEIRILLFLHKWNQNVLCFMDTTDYLSPILSVANEYLNIKIRKWLKLKKVWCHILFNMFWVFSSPNVKHLHCDSQHLEEQLCQTVGHFLKSESTSVILVLEKPEDQPIGTPRWGQIHFIKLLKKKKRKKEIQGRTKNTKYWLVMFAPFYCW